MPGPIVVDVEVNSPPSREGGARDVYRAVINAAVVVIDEDSTRDRAILPDDNVVAAGGLAGNLLRLSAATATAVRGVLFLAPGEGK